VSEPASIPLSALRRGLGLQIVDSSLADVIQAANELSWTRDPFDRLISAHAIVANAPLVTADETIREHLPLAVWD
jgi:PIN domain nuclease of toxin-antitoxin system